MEDLAILSNLINKQTAKNIEVINSKFKKSQKQYLLYEKILNGEISNDVQGSQILFNQDPNYPAYIKLKYRLRKRLLNSLFFLDLNKSKHSEYNQAKINSFKDWATINLLMNRGARKPAIKICQSMLKHAIKYDFTDIQLLICRILSKHYAFVDVNKKKYQKYQNMLFEKLELFNAELKTESYYNLISHLHFDNSNHAKKIALLDEYTAHIKVLRNKYQSYIINYNYYQLEAYRFLQLKNFKKAKSICEEAIEYLKTSNTESKIAEFAFRRDLHFSLLQMGELDKAKNLILLNIKSVKPGGYNWFREWHHYFIWATASQDHEQMIYAVQTVVTNSKIRHFKLIQEIWKLKEAYIHLLLKSNLIDQNNSQFKLKQFRISKFLNEVPNYSKDKKGVNISILIVHLLFLIINKKYDITLKRIDSLKQYSFRYLKNDNSMRSNCFIKMLCKIPDANYNPIALKRHTEKLYKKLSSTNYSFSDNPAELEVIPYENLWEIVLSILDNNVKKKRA